MRRWYPTENRWAQRMIFSSFVSKGRGGRVVQMSVPSVGENIHVAATRCTDLHLGGKGWGSVSLCRCWLKSGTPHQHRTPPAHTWWSKGGTACFHGFNHQRWMGSMCRWYPTENRWAQHMIFSSFVSKGRGGRVVQMSVPSVTPNNSSYLSQLPFNLLYHSERGVWVIWALVGWPAATMRPHEAGASLERWDHRPGWFLSWTL